MAEVAQAWRDYHFSCDHAFLAGLWPKARLALEYAWPSGGCYGDPDAAMEGEQHSTTNIAYFGPNLLLSILYHVAPRAGAAIARELGDPTTAAGYKALAEAGPAPVEAILWNGKRYQQRLDLRPDPGTERYRQVEDGCLTDQLFGQWHANLTERGLLVAPKRVRRVLQAIYRHNVKRMAEVPTNVVRAFAVNDERGVVVIAFPWARSGIIPLTAIFRAPEVWNGGENQVACQVIQEGLTAEGQAIVDAIRQCHDGLARSPKNEPECGYPFARSPVSDGLSQAYAGSHFNPSRGGLAVNPRPNRDHFRTFFPVEGAGGSLQLAHAVLTIEVAAGQVMLPEVVVEGRTHRRDPATIVRPGKPAWVEDFRE